ncbi:preprotein translocase subunit YajC [Treponema parvum]|uniref:Sec translocon accessory complex subunit YajC n=1 Tax=Treponema parvum TaxID=138851 RepID=A0A975IEQ0_9SPIR|nr:preprotein translocase subunit YajC [Treponema parvum]QTQ13499.1 preprotein translocase subunit YajC [Treponema parvum]
MSFIPYLQAAGGANSIVSFAPFALIILIFYFFIIRPQSKKQKETQKMLDALKKGDKVITIGGIHGVISSVKERTVVVKVDDNTKIEFNRSAVSAVVQDQPAASTEKGKKAASSEKAKADKSKAENADGQPASSDESLSENTEKK